MPDQTAFQTNAFQNDAFQIVAEVVILADPGQQSPNQRTAFRLPGRRAVGHAREVSGFYGLSSPRVGRRIGNRREED